MSCLLMVELKSKPLNEKNNKCHCIRYAHFPITNIAIYKNIISDVDAVSDFIIIIKGMVIVILFTTRSEKMKINKRRTRNPKGTL